MTTRKASVRDDGVFVLFGDCVPVKGARRSALCDVTRRRLRLIPNMLFDILTQHARQPMQQIKAAHSPDTHDAINDYFAVLTREEYGFWCDEPEHFRNVEFTWDPPARCSNAVIDVDAAHRHDFSALCEQLDALGCVAIQVRFHDAATPAAILEIVREAEQRRFRHLDFVVPIGPAIDLLFLRQLCATHSIVSGAVLYGADMEHREIVESGGAELRTTAARLDLGSCGQIDKKSFCVNTWHFAEAQCFNTCLNGKVSIAANGDIKACPSMRGSYGNVRVDRLERVLQNSDLQAYWHITKDQVEVCKDCEFRYVCTDCRANTVGGGRYSKPAGCRYDPYTATWA